MYSATLYPFKLPETQESKKQWHRSFQVVQPFLIKTKHLSVFVCVPDVPQEGQGKGIQTELKFYLAELIFPV